MRTGGSESRARQRSDEDKPRHEDEDEDEDEDENGGVGQGRRDLETDDARETGKFCFGPLLLACPGKDGCVTTRRAALACHNSAFPCPQPAPEWPELPPFLVVPYWPVARQGCNGQGAQKKEPTGHGCVGGRRKQLGRCPPASNLHPRPDDGQPDNRRLPTKGPRVSTQPPLSNNTTQTS